MSRQFILREPQHAHTLIAYLKQHAGPQSAAGRPLVVTVDEYKARRSSEQNRLFHALLNEISEQAMIGGKHYDADTWKELIRRKFIGSEEINLPDGSRLERGISTTTLSVPEFTQLIDRVTAWAATELNVIL